MPQLDISTLNLKNILDLYYIESLSIDNLPDTIYSTLSKSMRKFHSDLSNNFENCFEGKLNFFNSFGTSTEQIKFQAHDLSDPKIIARPHDNYILINTIGFSFSDQKEYDISLSFENLSNYNSTLYEYSKGKLNASREVDFDTLFNKYSFNFREMFIFENEKLEPVVQLLFIHDKNTKFSDFGERKILTLSFTPEIVSKLISEINPSAKFKLK